MALLQYRPRMTLKSNAQKESTCNEKTFLKSSFIQFTHELVAFIKCLQSCNVISKLLCP